MRYHIGHVPGKLMTNCLGEPGERAQPESPGFGQQDRPRHEGAPPAPVSKPVSRTAPADDQEAVKAIKSGANWFYWIAVLSVVNSLILFFGGQWSFMIGLGATQMTDAFTWIISESLGLGAAVVGLGMSLAIAGLAAAIGFAAGKGQVWVFGLGMFLYACDGLLFVFVADWLSLAFHAFVLYGLYRGLKASLSLRPAGQAALVEQTS